jgi:hypothetical protein
MVLIHIFRKMLIIFLVALIAGMTFICVVNDDLLLSSSLLLLIGYWLLSSPCKQIKHWIIISINITIIMSFLDKMDKHYKCMDLVKFSFL